MDRAKRTILDWIPWRVLKAVSHESDITTQNYKYELYTELSKPSYFSTMERERTKNEVTAFYLFGNLFGISTAISTVVNWTTSEELAFNSIVNFS